MREKENARVKDRGCEGEGNFASQGEGNSVQGEESECLRVRESV